MSDAAFDPNDTGPTYVYVLPVVVNVPKVGEIGQPEYIPEHTYRAAAKLELLGSGDYNVDKVFGVDPAYDPDPCANCKPIVPGGTCRPLCDLSGIRELEVDASGNVYVASGSQYNDNDWLLIYNETTGNSQKGYEVARHNLNRLFVNTGFTAPESPGALRVSSHTPGTVYLTSLVGGTDGLTTRVYRLAVGGGGPL